MRWEKKATAFTPKKEWGVFSYYVPPLRKAYITEHSRHIRLAEAIDFAWTLNEYSPGWGFTVTVVEVD